MAGKQYWLRRMLVMLCAALLTPIANAEFEHTAWQQLLVKHVYVLREGRASQVDYRGMASDRQSLADYLSQLAKVTESEYQAWTPPQQLAFLINAYNAWTVELILRHYPDIDSIRDIGGWFGSPWKQEIVALLGKTRSLDELEHQMIRPHFREPRIHFAVNCASVGCPALLPEAYRGEQLDKQLEAATKAFLADRQRNALRQGRLSVSRIFDWYAGDFAQGWRGLGSLREFLAHYGEALGLTPLQRQALRDGQLRIVYGDYDWRLNDRPGDE